MLKNKQYINEKIGSVMVAELISSAHDVIEMESFFYRLKSNYEKLYSSQKFTFRFVVVDFS